MKESEIKPFDMRILVMPDEEKDTTESGLYVARALSGRTPYRVGTVLSSGVTDSLQPGDRIMFKRQGGLDVELDAGMALLLMRDDVLARLEQ